MCEQRRLLALRANDLLAQSSTETLLDMLKSHAGIKDCSEETVFHINGVCSYFKNIMCRENPLTIVQLSVHCFLDSNRVICTS